MKTVAKVVMLGLVIAPIALLGGCAKKCHETVSRHKHVEKVEKEYGGK